MHKHKEMFSAFVDILFPRVCHICSKSLKEDKTAFDKNICLRCAQEMARTSVVSCSLCAQKLDTEKELRTLLCRSCAKEPCGYEKLLACFIYQGPTKELIHKFKYGNRPYLAKTIARLMLTTLEHDGQSLHKKADAIVPVPLHTARSREREFNQSRLLAEEFSSVFGAPVSAALIKIRPTPAQASLPSGQRAGNVSGVFSVSDEHAVRGKNLLLIDDVVTTTATVREASLALKTAGAARITVLAFAKG